MRSTVSKPSQKGQRTCWVGIGALIMGLLACGTPDTGPARLDDYLTRLERAVEGHRPSPPLERPPRLSEAQLKKLPIQGRAISVLDFLALSGCELQVNIGRRNSTLGRNASSSQVLLLDLEFLHQVPPCAAKLKAGGEEQLASTLEALAEERKNSLPQRIFNALLAGPEFLALWQLPPHLGDYPVRVSSDVIASLDYFDATIRQWLNGDYSVNFATDNSELEGHLATLRAGDGGALLLASTMLNKTLEQASKLLIESNEDRPLCPQGRVSRRAEIAQNVVAKFFTAHTQPWLASVHARRHGLMTPISAIEEQLEAILPQNYRQWQQQRNQTLAATSSAPRDHITAIKAIFSSCTSVPWGS